MKQFFFALNKYLLILGSYLVFTSAIAQPASIDICKYASQTTNKSLPIKKDNLTTLKETGCLISSPKNIFIYILEVSVPAEIAKQINFNKEIKPNVLNTFCTDPQVRAVLNAFDIAHRYYTVKGEYVGSFSMASNECK